MLAAADIAQFEREGYLVVDELLDLDTDIAPVEREYNERLRELCRNWVAEGRLDAQVLAGDFSSLVQAVNAAGLEYFQPLDISLPPGHITTMTPFHAGPAVFQLIVNEKLLDIAESLLGPELTSNPIQHVRIKPPLADVATAEQRAHIVGTHWHQDRGVAHASADASRMLTVWLAITDATEENGCLRVVPGSHRQEMLTHCPVTGQLAIPTKLFDESSAVTLPVKAGGAVLLHANTIHASLENHSRDIRWSFDLRYNVTGDPSGRECFPSFVARSRRSPESELRSASQWHALWEQARETLSQEPPLEIHRWPGDAPACA